MKKVFLTIMVCFMAIFTLTLTACGDVVPVISSPCGLESVVGGEGKEEAFHSSSRLLARGRKNFQCLHGIKKQPSANPDQGSQKILQSKIFWEKGDAGVKSKEVAFWATSCKMRLAATWCR